MTTAEPRRDPVLRAIASWQPARVLMTANRMGIFAAIGEEALTAEEVAQRCQAHPRSTALLHFPGHRREAIRRRPAS